VIRYNFSENIIQFAVRNPHVPQKEISRICLLSRKLLNGQFLQVGLRLRRNSLPTVSKISKKSPVAHQFFVHDLSCKSCIHFSVDSAHNFNFKIPSPVFSTSKWLMSRWGLINFWHKGSYVCNMEVRVLVATGKKVPPKQVNSKDIKKL
jgi:hypothetical protein